MPSLGCGQKKTTTAGTAVPLATQAVPVDWLQVQALVGTTGAIVIGPAGVIAAAATRKGVVVPEPGVDGANSILPLFLPGPLNLANVYINSTIDAEGVSFLYHGRGRDTPPNPDPS